ncbi:MAG: 5-(carboxyamino)imidazole ribonucleotide synthase [Opitutia bacterium Tous-C2FEB]|jgi:5-(carboxyamino)imidazole ribonucleotide synthase|nr:MAG: 5-(carboxyamino)imidazole ribonucleotide synthase [Opitutae bacterium Tous-C2FEB]PAZ02112.1 MAG: 5-(carboxyamino)imidazole ribonucleotide synthase [Opitutae bacterium AMD-G3]
MERPLLPGGTIGILGGGQLGRMSAIAARRMGYKVKTFDPSAQACAAAIADDHTAAEWNDTAALTRFAQGCGRITLEFENIPPATVEFVAQSIPSHPSANVLAICQNRRREKEFLRASGIPCANFAVVSSLAELQAAVRTIGFPCVLKTADFGYDGKGQVKLPTAAADLAAAWNKIGGGVGVLEAWVPFQLEISVLVARTVDGRTAVYDAAENLHRNHILHLSLSPARISAATATEARTLALGIAEQIGLVGLLAVEMFVQDGRIVVNELAPRPHNSGHQTFDANETSQFEQHIRAVCGLPLGGTKPLQPSVMLNLLGDLWKNGQAPDWTQVLADPSAKLHLYDKGTAAPGRKMGHVTVTAPTLAEALRRAEGLFATLSA